MLILWRCQWLFFHPFVNKRESSFRAAPPSIRKILPKHLHTVDTSRGRFLRQLKTSFFLRAYSSDSVYTIQLVVKPVEQPAASCKQTFNRLFSRFENRLNVCFHDTAGCSTAVVKLHERTFSLAPLKPCLHDAADCSIGYSTALTTGCIVYTNIQPVEQPVECLCTRYSRLSSRLSNQLNNRLNNQLRRVNKYSTGCSTGLRIGCIV